ncbi:hypothetical protein XELAEV_18029838mg [Xenopus laevis]|uniref:Uncharacterized protein n=1 Tax=Xenopus laevis TaxID=8355 RepID=A0A974CS70_XENLA|nr:hypothetical protein XELAEV_18029838mg [Xenopus laevis]
MDVGAAGAVGGLALGGRRGAGPCDGSSRAAAPGRDPVGAMDVGATLRQAWPREEPGAARCVRSVDDQCVLQFTLILAASCVLHRCV